MPRSTPSNASWTMTFAQRATAEALLDSLAPVNHFFRWSSTGDERVVMVAQTTDDRHTLVWIERDGELAHSIDWG